MNANSKIKKVIQFPIIESRWILTIFCYGLVIAQACYALAFVEQVGHIMAHFWTMKESEILMVILTLLDMFMIAVLSKMIVSGNYQNSIDRLPEDHGEKLSSGMLKVKMATSLIGVSAINLLQTYINPESVAIKFIIVKCSIHVIFLISAFILAVIEYLHVKGEALEKLQDPAQIKRIF